MLRNIVRFGGFLFLFHAFVVLTPARAGDSYLDKTAASASYLAQGKYDAAVAEASAALVHRTDDPLAHIALGTALLHTRQVDAAMKEFTTANSLANDDSLALYGLGLCHLSKNNRGAALDCLRRFDSAQRGGERSIVDASPALAYLAALAGSYPTDTALTGPVLSQIAAQGYAQNGAYAEARKLLESVVADRKAFVESFGAVMTFDARTPVALTAPKLAKPYKSTLEPQPGLKKISGPLTLRADLSDARGVAYVLFYVDDNVVGIVNHPPYECQFDTRRLSNAQHVIKIEGRDDSGTVISDKSARVHVFNKDSVTSDPAAGEEVRAIRAKLWESLQLKPSLRLAYYGLIKCAEALKDDAAALSAAECLVGIEPDYKDARALLLRHYAPIPQYRDIWKVKTDQKIAAITFDDGPNIGTPKLLDILASKDVKATFFVVGSMAEIHPDVVRRMAKAGHQIESHTYSHRNLAYIPKADIERELIRNQSVIRSIIGKAPRFFRAPGGHQNGVVAKTGATYGLSQVKWTVNCSGTEGKTPEVMRKLVMKKTVPGSVILMHNTEPITMMALPKIIDELRAKGYRLVTLAELLAAS